jgi:hypothetical protein
VSRNRELLKAGYIVQHETPIKKKLIILTGLAFLNFMVGMALALEVHSGFALIAFGVPLVCGAIMVVMKCPRCGYPVLKRERRLFGVTWTYWGGFRIPSRCQNCGTSFEDARRD